MFPGLADALAQQRQVNNLIQNANSQKQAQAQLQQAQQQAQQPGMMPMAPQQPQQNRGSNMTQAAAQSIMAGAAPAI
jgi:hypothetical protein